VYRRSIDTCFCSEMRLSTRQKHVDPILNV
jgi:hypothetical protein